MSDRVPTVAVDLFADLLREETKRYDLGIFLGAPTHKLDEIYANYRLEALKGV